MIRGQVLPRALDSKRQDLPQACKRIYLNEDAIKELTQVINEMLGPDY